MGVGVRTASGLEGEGRLKGWGGWNGGGVGMGGGDLVSAGILCKCWTYRWSSDMSRCPITILD